MKKSIFLIVALMIFLIGCTPQIRTRINNEYPANLPAFKVGSVDYGNVLAKTKTDYKDLTTGSHDISVNNVKVGSVTFTVRGTFHLSPYLFTIKVNNDAAGSITLEQDTATP